MKRMDEKSDSGAYDSWHGQLEVDAGDAPWHELVRVHLSSARDVAGLRLLEIGCGRGGFSVWLASVRPAPASVVAMDYSAVAVEKAAAQAAQRGVQGVTWQVGDIQAIPHADASFDTVFSCETIEHVPDPARAVCELARVLKPGGRLFLTTPNYLGTYGLYRAYLRLRGRRYTEAGQPINHFTTLPRTLAWVRAAGLTPSIVDAVGHYLHWPGREPLRISALDRARFATRWVALHSLVVAEKG